MTEVAVNYLVSKLLKLGRQNVELIAGVQDKVNDLVTDLQILKAFFRYQHADMSGSTGQTVQLKTSPFEG